jgi:hypothetical protein
VNRRKHILAAAIIAAFSSGASAQIPDLLTALDAGGRAMGLGGATYVTDSTTFSANANPAGLGYISQPVYGVAYRNLPESRTTITGDFTDPDFDTTMRQGAFGLTHVGYAFPMGRGTLGVSYTRGGFVRDERSGDGLVDGALTVRNYEEVLRSQTDLFTVSYGANSGGATNYGIGVVIANQYVLNRQDYDLFNGSTQVGSVSADNSGTGLGFGVVAGVMVATGANSSFGVSAQSPIDLSGNSQTDGYLDRIPGRLSAGFATRSDRANGQYLLWAVQASSYFGGQSNKVFARDNYTVVNAGVEYMLRNWNARVPLRFGYAYVPKGGEGFISRDSFTFGVGYRPDGSDFTLDLSFARPVDGNALDMALSITHLLGKK